MTSASTSGGTVVLGAGSPLLGDDGLGVQVIATLVDRWAESPTLSFLDGGIWGMRLLPHIEDARQLLVVDAIRAGARPGTLIRLERDEIPKHLRGKLSTHQIDLGEVFAVAELRGHFPAEAVALGIEPESFDAFDELSGTVRARVPALLAAIERQLTAWGHVLEPRGPGLGPIGRAPPAGATHHA
ncbi:MAG: HyaD/HybD family hydrogenase maturation endopeptidase [Longimicrobiales bacterium]